MKTVPRNTEKLGRFGYTTDGEHRPCKRCYPNSESGRVEEVIRFAIDHGSLGSILVATSQKGICAVLLGDEQNALVADLKDRFPKATLIESHIELQELTAKIVRLIEAPNSDFKLPLDLRGTKFRKSVWQAVCEIPTGSTLSYTEIAEKIGRPGAVRGVAQACGANALAVLIPCHRVLRRDGKLSGYRWGVERKRSLLQLELAG
jgi:AraC family transcriptional regulator of adaptative response/methylated-DNA-[protein]-cysteine methyltransferase